MSLTQTIDAGQSFDYVNGESSFRRIERRLDVNAAFVRNTAKCCVVSNTITIPVAATNTDVEVVDPRNSTFIPAQSILTSVGVFFTEVCDVGAVVSLEKDAVDNLGNPRMQSVDYKNLVPILWSALQDALKRIDDLENK